MHKEIPAKDVKAMKAKIVEEAKEMVEESFMGEGAPGKGDSLQNLLVEVYAHNATFQARLTPVGVDAILKALK